MADRPEDFVDYATNANYTTGPQIGQPTKVALAAIDVQDGNKRGLDNAPDAQKFNWWQNAVGRWVRYFAGFFPEATPPAGQVLTSDGSGGATWQPGGGGSGDLSNLPPVNVTRATAAPGTSGEAARADHKHDIAVANVVTVGTANSAGTGSALARADHVHAHGNQPGGSLHALATTTTAGFMSPADKDKLDGLGPGGGGGGASGFLNVVDHGVLEGALADTAARQANRDVFNDAIATAIATNKILLVPPGTYEVHGPIVIADSRFRWLGTTGSVIVQHQLDAAGVHVGPPLGTDGVVEGVFIDGVYIRYAGVGAEGANALELTGVWISRFENIEIGDVNATFAGRTSVPHIGIHLDGEPATVPCFSNTFKNVRIKHFGFRAINAPRPTFNAASTGSVWTNIYISGGDGSGQQDLSGVEGAQPIFMQMQAQGVFDQLNIEWLKAPTAIGLDTSGEMVFSAVNFEGVTLKQSFDDVCAFIQTAFSRATIDGLTLNNNRVEAANNVVIGCVLKCFEGSWIGMQNMRIESTTVSGAPFVFVRNWNGAGDTNVRVDLDRIALVFQNNLTAFDDFSFPSGDLGALFGTLSDFNNGSVVTVSNGNHAIHAYGTCGVVNVPASSTTKTIILSNICTGDVDGEAVIPRGVQRTINSIGTASVAVQNHNGSPLATLPAGSSASFVFNGSDWTLMMTSGGGGGGGGGVDLSNSPPVNVTKSAAAAGSGTTAARFDHKHDVATAAPVTIGTANAEGNSTALARANHVHAHGNLAGGSLHALATAALAGFMPSNDKAMLDAWRGIFFQPRSQPLVGPGAVFESTRLFMHDGFSYPTQIFSSFGQPWYRVYLTVPHLADRIQSIQVVLRGGSGHSALPAVKPYVALLQGNSALHSPVVDPSANVTAYQNDHILTISGPFNLTVGAPYMVFVAGEAGANSTSGLEIRDVRVAWRSSLFDL